LVNKEKKVEQKNFSQKYIFLVSGDPKVVLRHEPIRTIYDDGA